MKKLAIILTLGLSAAASADTWDRWNNPRIFRPIVPNKTINYSFEELPLVGALKSEDKLGWSESYWPSNKGGIAYRWNHPDPQPFTYKILTKEEVLGMSEAELAQLSPAELYDISQSDYNFTLTKKVLAKYSPDKQWWEGICHGWSLAASRYAEPDKVEVVNNDGVKVPFGSSDVKALLSMHDANNAQAYYVRVGRRCNITGKVPGEGTENDNKTTMPTGILARLPHCQDVNAGTFHVVISNMIGIHQLGFAADIDRFNDVWNQPITGYESTIISEEKTGRKKVARKVKIQTKMIFADELSFYSPELEAEGDRAFVSKNPVLGTEAQAYKERIYEYVLEIDAKGKIIGGEWLTASRPDMLWGRAKENEFHNTPWPLQGLNQIYKPTK